MVHPVAERLIADLASKGAMMVTAESCTGGLIGASLTDISGSSAVFERGYITYSNEAKMSNLGVSEEALIQFGAVSGEVAEQMAKGAVQASKAEFGISVTGIAGPGGGTEDKPVGLVYIGLAADDGRSKVIRHLFTGDRSAVRQQTVDTALTEMLDWVSGRL